MLSVKDCVEAHRPLIFANVENDLEFLTYLDDNFKDIVWYVYSKSFSGMLPMRTVLDSQFHPKVEKAQSIGDVLTDILNRKVRKETHHICVFLDSEEYVQDRMNIRRIKDILSRYQMEEDFTFNMIFAGNTTIVPTSLERLSEVVYFDLPDHETLLEISGQVSDNLGFKTRPSEEIVNNLKGLTAFEVEQAYLQSYNLFKEIKLDFIRDFKKSSIAKTDLLSLMETNVSFDDIGGMDRLKAWIEKSYGGWTIKGKKFGLPLLKGLLLVGLSGCGKSLISKALGNIWGLPVIQFDLSRVFSSRVGESEGNMRRTLQIIENISPCILFIDEIEKGFAGMQSSTFSDSGVTARVIGSFLVWFQECTKPVFTVATSNAIQYLPPELVSRFDETFFVNLPQFNERRAIFDIHLRKLNRKPDKFNIEALATKSADLSGREIEQVLKEAMYDAFHQNTELSDTIIMNVLDRKTSLLTTMAEPMKFILDWVGWDKEKQDGVRARFANPVENDEIGRVNQEIDSILKDIEGKPYDPTQ